MRLLSLLVLLSAAIWAAKIPLDSREAHQAADGIYELRFRAAFNEWGVNHRKPDESDAEHFSTMNAGDLERWKAVRKAWNDLDEAMTRAGY